MVRADKSGVKDVGPRSAHIAGMDYAVFTPEEEIVELIRKNFSLTPAGIIKSLDLRRPIYRQTAAYGHFGRTDVDLPWEHLDKVDVLKKALH